MNIATIQNGQALSEEIAFCVGCKLITGTVDHYEAIDDDGHADYSRSTCVGCGHEK